MSNNLLSSLNNLKNVGTLILNEASKHNVNYGTYKISFTKGVMPMMIDSDIDTGTITFPQDVRRALLIMAKSKAVKPLFNARNVVVYAQITLLQHFTCGILADIYNVLLRTGCDYLTQIKEIPIEDFNHLFQSDYMCGKLCDNVDLRVAYILNELGNRYNSFIFYESYADLLIKINATFTDLFNYPDVGPFNMAQLKMGLSHLQSKDVIKISQTMILFNRPAFYQRVSIMRNILATRDYLKE